MEDFASGSVEVGERHTRVVVGTLAGSGPIGQVALYNYDTGQDAPTTPLAQGNVFFNYLQVTRDVAPAILLVK